MLHQFMLNFFCGKSAFLLLFTGEVLASGIMLKDHLLVCQSEVRSQLLDTTWRWRCVYAKMGAQGFCQIIKTTLPDRKPYAKLICRQSLGDPQSESVLAWWHLTASLTGSTMMASSASFYIYVLLDFSLATFSPLPQTIETFVLGSTQRWLLLKAA